MSTVVHYLHQPPPGITRANRHLLPYLGKGLVAGRFVCDANPPWEESDHEFVTDPEDPKISCEGCKARLVQVLVKSG